MTTNSIVERWLREGFTNTELEQESITDIVLLWYFSDGESKERARRHLLERIVSTLFWFYPCYSYNAYPYQEEQSEERSVLLFSNEGHLRDYVKSVASEEELEHIEDNTLGFDGKELIGVLDQLYFFGLTTVLIPQGTKGDPVFSCTVEELRMRFGKGTRTGAVNVQRLIGILTETLLFQKEKEFERYLPQAQLYAAEEPLLVPLDKAGNPMMENGEMLVFTDISAFHRMSPIFEDYNRVAQLTFQTWDWISSFDLPVTINFFLRINRELSTRMNFFTTKGEMAMYYIQDEYRLDIFRSLDKERAQKIYEDIEAAKPLLSEMFRHLTTIARAGAPGVEDVTCEFAEGEELTRVAGTTAKELVDTGYCDSAIKAYHVLSLLYNDKTGEYLKQFENAELFE